jgi:arylsulfatase
VLLILVDGAGFGNPSTFGDPCQAPALDRVAESGQRYTTFHSTALGSPTHRRTRLIPRRKARTRSPTVLG